MRRRLRPASLRRRFVAAAVHGWPGGVGGLLSKRFDVDELDGRRQLVLAIGGVTALLGLDWWVARAVLDRQSLGAAVAGIELVTRDGRRASLLRCIVREMVPAGLVRPLRRGLAPDVSLRWQLAETAALAAIGRAVVLARDDRRSIGDLVAGTRLVEAR